jgi:hypothetical protein
MKEERSACLEPGSDSQVRSRAVERIASGTTARSQVDAMTRRPGSRSRLVASLNRCLKQE